MRLSSDVGIYTVKLHSLRAKTFKDFKLPIESSNSPESYLREIEEFQGTTAPIRL